MKIAICDDEEVWIDFAGKVIKDYLKRSKNVAEVVFFMSGESLLESKEKFDLIFLDEEMEGINGLETAMRLRKFDNDVKLVFITSHTDMMQKAFCVNTYRFLNKRFEKEDIEDCLNDYFDEIKSEKDIEIDVQGVSIAVKQKDIVYITTIRNGTIIFCNNEHFVSKYSLKHYEEMLDSELFTRCRRNAIVNISHIDWIDECIILYGGNKLKYSQRKKTELKHLYTKYILRYAR